MRDDPGRRTSRILVIDDLRQHAELVGEALSSIGNECVITTTEEEALEELRTRGADLIITDLKLGETDGLDLIRNAHAIDPFIGVIVVTGHGTIESAVEAMHRGAEDYLLKPVDISALRFRVEKVLEGQALKRRAEELERTIDSRFGFEGIIGSSQKMHRIIQKLQQVSTTDASVLLLGESGTGKDLLAKAIHANSRRKGNVFVPLNCAALGEGILESELFGHERGAFTGASSRRKGRFEHADGGTLFLDEVGDIPPGVQVKLLRVLEEREVTRMGSNVPVPVDARLISATHRDLRSRIVDGSFREDLFYRLNVVTIEIPPLRERAVDIPLLVHHFLEEYARIHGKTIEGLSREALRVLVRHPWPGNVRELKNAVENMVVTAPQPVLGLEDLPGHIRPEEEESSGVGFVVGTTIREMECELIRATLEALAGNRREAAETLGIGERTLYRKITEYDLR
ncbi:MAG TPA: sigma-54-dependent Fis family transcriptional regulator [Planctomycetes bacterium]|nr:sigma-54-dependent Fis family transcriptional regulator [Planctomycetota bacterium]HIN80109.1 sigma-54-dependent Fis family transcriptional regulator [Planctomycetota bacterium]